jgi:hypothetical protein
MKSKEKKCFFVPTKNIGQAVPISGLFLWLALIELFGVLPCESLMTSQTSYVVLSMGRHSFIKTNFLMTKNMDSPAPAESVQLVEIPKGENIDLRKIIHYETKKMG